MFGERHNIKTELEKLFSSAERVVIAGIGNPIRMDDFVGVKIVQNLRGKVSNTVYLIECETVPESYVQQIIDYKPTHILLIDAAMLGLEHGESRLINPEQLANFSAFSTHMLPLRIFCDYLAKTTEAKIALLLIQPKQTDFGEGLTSEVESSAEVVSETLSRVLSRAMCFKT